MADEVVGLQGSFSVDTSSLDSASTRVQATSNSIVSSLQNVKNASNELTVAANRQKDAMMASFIPLQKLQVEGLKFQDTLKQQEGFLSRNAGKLMVLSQVADDAQYGLRAIVNQVPMAVAAFGGSMGLAGAIGVVAVAANVLTTHWDKLKESLHGSVVKSEAEYMQKLADATKNASKEAENLARTQRTEAGIKSQKATAGETPEERAGKAGVAQMLAGGDYDAILKQVMQSNAVRVHIPQVTDADVTAREMQTLGASGGGLEGREKTRKTLEEERRKQYKDVLLHEAQKILADAQFGQGKEADDARTIIEEELAKGGNEGLSQRFRSTTRKGVQEDQMRALEVEQAQNVAAYDREQALKKLSDPLAFQDIEAEAGDRQHEAAMKEQEERDKLDQERMKLNEARNKEFFDQTDDEKKLKKDRQSLDEKLRGILVGDRRYNTSQSMGLESYEGSIKATTAEQQLKKQEEANKILAEIRKNTAERAMNARRVPRG
jgi:hypothetical protein